VTSGFIEFVKVAAATDLSQHETGSMKSAPSRLDLSSDFAATRPPQFPPINDSSFWEKLPAPPTSPMLPEDFVVLLRKLVIFFHSPMESEIAGWIGVAARFVHVLAAIMWIGNSLLFTWMEINLLPPKTKEDGEGKANPVLGYLDMLHGGGVFHLQKRVLDPKAIPVPLHWFMWQSYTTWISGAVLLVTVFYIHGGTALLDGTKSGISGGAAIAMSIGGIVLGWLVYDSLWRSKLKNYSLVAIPVSLVLILGAAWFFNQFFNGRAVYLQIGAMMGTFMSANVFFHIIGNQKKYMADLEAGRPHNSDYGKAAKTRSLHNHYMTYPVLFLMLSAHFPQVTSAAWNIPILAVLTVTLMYGKFLLNSRNQNPNWLVSLFGSLGLAGIVIAWMVAWPEDRLTALPKSASGSETSEESVIDPNVTAGARLFVSQTCATCHQGGSSQLGPALNGIYGRTVTLSDGSRVVSNEAYLRTSIVNPQAQIVKGYPASMPSFAHLKPEQVDQLVAYLKWLK